MLTGLQTGSMYNTVEDTEKGRAALRLATARTGTDYTLKKEYVKQANKSRNDLEEYKRDPNEPMLPRKPVMEVVASLDQPSAPSSSSATPPPPPPPAPLPSGPRMPPTGPGGLCNYKRKAALDLSRRIEAMKEHAASSGGPQ